MTNTILRFRETRPLLFRGMPKLTVCHNENARTPIFPIDAHPMLTRRLPLPWQDDVAEVCRRTLTGLVIRLFQSVHRAFAEDFGCVTPHPSTGVSQYSWNISHNNATLPFVRSLLISRVQYRGANST